MIDEYVWQPKDDQEVGERGRPLASIGRRGAGRLVARIRR